MSTVDEAKRAKVELACSTAETFIQLYYDRLDSKRHLIGKLYMDNATMSWNGNRLEGALTVQQFVQDRLPDSCHDLTSLDSQPVLDSAVAGQTTVAVQVAGAVKYKGMEQKPFQQTFLIAEQDGKWKVATDTFRYPDDK